MVRQSQPVVKADRFLLAEPTIKMIDVTPDTDRAPLVTLAGMETLHVMEARSIHQHLVVGWGLHPRNFDLNQNFVVAFKNTVWSSSTRYFLKNEKTDHYWYTWIILSMI